MSSLKKTLDHLEIFNHGYETMTREIFDQKNEGSLAVFELADQPKRKPDLVTRSGDKYWFYKKGIVRTSENWSNGDEGSLVGRSYWKLEVAGLSEWYPGFEEWYDNNCSEKEMCGYSNWDNIFLLKKYFPQDLPEYPLGFEVPQLPFVMFNDFFLSDIRFRERTSKPSHTKTRDIHMNRHPNHIVAQYGMITIKLMQGCNFDDRYYELD